MNPFTAIVIGVVLWAFFRCIYSGFYTVNQNERAVKTIFGRAERVGNATTGNSPLGEMLSE